MMKYFAILCRGIYRIYISASGGTVVGKGGNIDEKSEIYLPCSPLIERLPLIVQIR